jgi:hypothetical protein
MYSERAISIIEEHMPPSSGLKRKTTRKQAEAGSKQSELCGENRHLT